MRKLLCLTTLLVAGAVQGQSAPVEELRSETGRSGESSAASQAVIDLHYELQALRDEVRQLRGIVEQQSHELRQLKQRQLDDYQDLDRRLRDLRAADDTGPATGSPIATRSSSDDTPASAGEDGGDGAETPAQGNQELQRYTAAYEALRERKIDEAVKGFRAVVEDYPDGQYAANAYYWLGEIYLLKNELEQAESAFDTITERFPAHRKGPDARFKLAKVYHLQGRDEQARSLLQEVAQGNSSAASLARNYLDENF